MNSVCDSLPVKVYFYVRFFMRVDSDHLPEESEKILVNVLSYILSQIVLVRWFKLVYFLNNFCAVWKMVKQDGQIHLCSIMFSHSNVAVN